jgi:hypothetical protein
MKKKYLIILFLTMFIMPFNVLASGGFGVSSTSISMYQGESKTITITSNNAVGKLNISTSNNGVASVSLGSIFIQNPGSSESFSITGNSIGTATISVVASDNFATMDEEILKGETKTITVNVIEKPTSQSNSTPSNPSTSKSTPSSSQASQSQNNKSTNNNLKDISVDGYELTKVDNNNYTLSVSNNVTSININANAEDSKANVSGTGNHELNIGENNIELIITSESGSENKIIIKVTRKDGYYIDDLDNLLSDNKIKDINIIIESDTKISSKYIQKIKNSKKSVTFSYYNSEKVLMYSWIINGSKLKNTNELVSSVKFDSNNKKDILKLSNYADGMYVSLNNSNKLSGNVKLRVYVGNKYSNDDNVNVYLYSNNKLELVSKNNKVDDGYIEFNVKSFSDYFITMSDINSETIVSNSNNDNSIPIISIVVILCIILILALIFIFRNKLFKKRKGDNKKQ